MGLPPTDVDENTQFHTVANRAATVRSGNDLVNFNRFFRGVPMGLRPINDNENRLGAGSVSDLVCLCFLFSSLGPCFSTER